MLSPYHSTLAHPAQLPAAPAPAIASACAAPALPAPAFIVRVVALPLDLLHQLRFERTVARIDALLSLDRWLQAQAEPLSDAFYAVIGGVTDKQLRYRLLNLRRAIFQSRLPRPADLAAEVWQALPADLASSLADWLEHATRRADLAAGANDELLAEWGEKRRLLEQIAGAEPFMQGLLLASPDLQREVQRWRSDGAAAALDRKIELALFTYLGRVAAKTSPYSTFTSSAWGFWTPDGPAVEYAPAGWQRLSAIELNRITLYQLVRGMLDWPEIRAVASIRVNPSLVAVDGQLHLFSTASREALRRVPATPTVGKIVDLVRTARAPTYGGLVSSLAPRGDQSRRAQIAAYLDQLIALGVLEIDPGIPDQAIDYLGELLAFLEPIDSARVALLHATLGQVRERLARFAESAAEERCRLRDELYDLLRQLYRQLELDRQGLGLPQKNVFYEDTLLDQLDMRAALPHWRGALDDLDLLRQVSALYDRFLVGRLGTTAFFVDHYGAGSRVPLLSFFETWHQETSQPAGWRAGYRVSGALLAELFERPFDPIDSGLAEHALVMQLRQIIPTWLARQPIHPVHGYQLDPVLLRRMVADFPPFITPAPSIAFYCQALMGDDAPRLVLNTLGNGFQRVSGRLGRLAATLAGPFDGVPDVGDPDGGHLYVDVAGTFGSTLNLRTIRTPYELAYPGSFSARPLDEQLPINDLSVLHDPHTDRLVLMSDRLGRELFPVHLGQTDNFWLPPFYQFILRVFSTAPVKPLFFIDMPNMPRLRPDLPIHFLPRITLGQVVIDRARWVCGVAQLPQRESGSMPFDSMLALQRWRVANDLPTECYLRLDDLDVVAGGTQDNSSRTGRNMASKSRKPLYLDMENYLSAMMFERAIQDADQVICLQEALPGSGDALVRTDQGVFTSEFVIELPLQEDRR